MTLKIKLESPTAYEQKDPNHPDGPSVELATCAKSVSETAQPALETSGAINPARLGRCLILHSSMKTYLELELLNRMDPNSQLARKISGIVFTEEFGPLMLNEVENGELRGYIQSIFRETIFEPRPQLEYLNQGLYKAPVRTFLLLMHRPTPLNLPTVDDIKEGREIYKALEKAAHEEQKQIKHPAFPREHFFQLPDKYKLGQKFPMLGGEVGCVLPDGAWKTIPTLKWRRNKKKDFVFYPVAPAPQAAASAQSIAPKATTAVSSKGADGVKYQVLLDWTLNQYLQYDVLPIKSTPLVSRLSRIFVTGDQPYELLLNEADRAELLGYIKPPKNAKGVENEARLRSMLAPPKVDS